MNEKTNKFKLIIPLIALIIGSLIGLIGGYQYRSYEVTEAIKKAFNPDPISQEKAQQEQIKNSVRIDKNIGDLVEFTTIDFKVLDVTESNQVPNSKYSQPVIAREGSKFVYSNVEITNKTKSEFTYQGSMGIIDQKERKFLELRTDFTNVDNYILIRTLKPGIVEKGVMVFEVPNDTTSYSIVSGKTGTKELVYIKLK
jgi:hypothetical protein